MVHVTSMRLLSFGKGENVKFSEPNMQLYPTDYEGNIRLAAITDSNFKFNI